MRSPGLPESKKRTAYVSAWFLLSIFRKSRLHQRLIASVCEALAQLMRTEESSEPCHDQPHGWCVCRSSQETSWGRGCFLRSGKS
jgi:hypothetical protein